MKAEVSVRDGSGERLPTLANTSPGYATDVFHSIDEQADARVRQIIAANDSVAGGKAADAGAQKLASLQ